MSSQGSPYQRFQRALGTGNAMLSWVAAHELPRLELHDALALVLVLGRSRDANFHRAVARWVANYAQSTRCDVVEVDLVRACLIATATGTVRAGSSARQAFCELLEQRDLTRCLEALERHAPRWP